MRVLVVTCEDPEVLIGGRGTHVKELYREMAKLAEVEIDMITIGPGDRPKNYYGVRKFTSDKLVCWKPRRADVSCMMTNDIQMMRTLMSLMAEGARWDIVHVHDWDAFQVGQAVRDAMKIPLLSAVHLCLTQIGDSTGAFTVKGGPPEQYLYCCQQEAHLVTRSDQVVVSSRAYADVLRKTFMVDRDIAVISNGIRLDEWHPGAGDGKRARIRHNLPDREIALFVGRIADMKGIRPLLRAVEDHDNGYCVVLVGEVNADTKKIRENWIVTKKIKQLIRQYPERIQWVGFQKGIELFDLYAAADVGLMPSINEPFGIVALEHMAMGVPLISTEVEGLGEVVVDGENEYALIIRPDSADDINTALRVMKSIEHRTDLATLGLERASHFRWDRIAKQFVELYRRAINHGDDQTQ
jgi:glycosyltransferase involved in cell wall biosynthesis